MTSGVYQEALKNAAKTMVRVKNPNRLLRMIVRFIVKEIGLSHASILMYDPQKKRYIFADSKGNERIPVNLIKLDEENPIIKWFAKKDTQVKLSKDYLSLKQIESWVDGTTVLNHKNPAALKRQLEQIHDVMLTLKASLCVPGFYNKELLGVLILGNKLSQQDFDSLELSFFQTLANNVSMALKNAKFQDELLVKNIELENQKKILQERLLEIERLRQKEQETYYQIVMSLAREVYAKDPYTCGHMEQVTRLGVMTAEEMGFDMRGRKKDILVASLHLHDVGKIGIPDAVLKKPASLNDEEWLIMKEHPVRGSKILEPLTDFKEVAHIVLHHHERYDGKGYPDGLKEEGIPMESRIISVVDAFHAIVSTRCYRKGKSIDHAFHELEANAGTQFDPQVVDAFLKAFKKAYTSKDLQSFIA